MTLGLWHSPPASFRLEWRDAEVVGLGAVELDDAQVGLGPVDAVARLGVGDVVALGEDLIPDAQLVAFPGDGAIDVGAGDGRRHGLPGLLALEDRVAGMLLGGVEDAGEALLLLDDPRVEEEPAPRALRRPGQSGLEGLSGGDHRQGPLARRRGRASRRRRATAAVAVSCRKWRREREWLLISHFWILRRSKSAGREYTIARATSASKPRA